MLTPVLEDFTAECDRNLALQPQFHPIEIHSGKLHGGVNLQTGSGYLIGGLTNEISGLICSDGEVGLKYTEPSFLNAVSYKPFMYSKWVGKTPTFSGFLSSYADRKKLMVVGASIRPTSALPLTFGAALHFFSQKAFLELGLHHKDQHGIFALTAKDTKGSPIKITSSYHATDEITIVNACDWKHAKMRMRYGTIYTPKAHGGVQYKFTMDSQHLTIGGAVRVPLCENWKIGLHAKTGHSTEYGVSLMIGKDD